jgi:chromosome partitioning protein
LQNLISAQVKKFVVTGFKGGIGKSVSSLHIAAVLQLRSSVVVIDGDPNESLIDWTSKGNLSIPVIRASEAKQKLKTLAPDYAVLDTAARPDLEELQALARQSDLLILPCTPDALSLRALTKTVKTLQALGSDKYRILLTRVPPGRKVGEQAAELLRSHGLPVFKTHIREYAAYEYAALSGQLVKDARDANGRKDRNGAIAFSDYLAMGHELP